MNSESLPARRQPAHPAPLRLVNQPTVLFVTVCVAGRRRLLHSAAAHRLLVDVWGQADRWRVGRYVVMPEHVHFFCAPGDDVTPLGKWMEYWRNTITRAWPVAAEKPIWQRDFWDRQLRREESYHEKWEYVRNNPVRNGFVTKPEDWPYQGELTVLRW
jgi:putative transposase